LFPQIICIMVKEGKDKHQLIDQLQQEILRWQGFKPLDHPTGKMDLGSLERAFPHSVFPTACIHEFIETTPEQVAATLGFVGGILAALMGKSGVCLWIGPPNSLYPPAMKHFGVEPERIIFVEAYREKDIFSALEEALKCDQLIAAVAELREMDFGQSLRLRLATEKSKATGFVLRHNPVRMGNTACSARWKVIPLPSDSPGGMPGVGSPKWGVQLLKVRSGNPGYWELQWVNGRFISAAASGKISGLPVLNRNTG